jgi:5-methylcytosine-specific restriction endonuclease McrA
VYCGTHEKITIDHFIPLVSGGDDILKNLVPACYTCNASKRHSNPIQWMLQKKLDEQYILDLLDIIYCH